MEQQRATTDILKAISAFPGDVQPVFDSIAESCVHLFGGLNVVVTLPREGHIELAAFATKQGLRNREQYEKFFPLPLNNESVSGRAMLSGQVVYVRDVQADDALADRTKALATGLGYRDVLCAPMILDRKSIGAISVVRAEAQIKPYTAQQIELLRTFANQGVIAAESVRLFKETKEAAIHNARLFQALEEKSRQLELANQHKSAFLTSMSHELRTPLNAVIGFARMLAARYYGELNDKQAEYVSDIVASGQHLLALINDILDLSKIEAGRMDLQPIAFDLGATLASAMSLVREHAQRGGIRLRLEADPALAQWYGDERKLKQVLLNLLTNAVKFTPRGGEVGVDAKLHDGEACICVTDTGIGIGHGDQEIIFEPFRQAASHATEGTGLGLALARRFVELHHGTLRVESEPGKGSTFTIALPVLHGE